MAARFPILTFHDIDRRSSVISFPPGLFRRGMEGLRQHGYRTLSLVQLVDFMESALPFPDRALAITFDDGYDSVYQEAFPVLQECGLTATIFLTVGEVRTDRLPSLNGRTMLTWRSIREMQRSGIEFGAHTMTHPDLTKLSTGRVEEEMHSSKSVIEDALGVPVTSFAYPFGRFDRQSREIAMQHFACACSDRLGLVRGSSDPHALERVDAYYLRSDRLFGLMRSGLFPGYIRLRSVPRRLRRVVTSWVQR